VSNRARAWVAIAPLLGVAACANVWGFDDLTLALDGGSRDATTASDALVGAADSGGDAEVDAGDDGYDSVDAGDSSYASDAPAVSDAPSYGEGGEGGGPNDGAVKDAGGDGAAAAACKKICPMGCCDPAGRCLGGTATSACGTGGNACEACPASACTLASPCCGATSQQCGCATADILCSKN
jgi:hypothetical protein